MWKPQSTQPATELDLGFMSVFLRFWTALASNDLRPGLGTSLQLPGALSPRKTLEMSLRLTAQPPGFQTMGNLSLHYSLPDLGGFWNVPGFCFLGGCSPLAALFSSLRPVLSMKAWTEASEEILTASCPTSAFRTFCSRSLSSVVPHSVWAWNTSEGFLSSHSEYWQLGADSFWGWGPLVRLPNLHISSLCH